MAKKKRLLILAISLLLCLGVLAGGFVGYKKLTLQPLPELGADFPEMRLLGQEGSIVTLKKFSERSSVLIVFMRGFYGFICPYCTEQTAELSDHHDELRELNAQLLIVFPGDEEAAPTFIEAVREHMKAEDREQVNIPLLLDVNKAMVKRLGIEGYFVNRPATFIVDRHGRLQYRYVGTDMTDRPALPELMDVLRRLQEESSDDVQKP